MEEHGAAADFAIVIDGRGEGVDGRGRDLEPLETEGAGDFAGLLGIHKEKAGRAQVFASAAEAMAGAWVNRRSGSTAFLASPSMPESASA